MTWLVTGSSSEFSTSSTRNPTRFDSSVVISSCRSLDRLVWWLLSVSLLVPLSVIVRRLLFVSLTPLAVAVPHKVQLLGMHSPVITLHRFSLSLSFSQLITARWRENSPPIPPITLFLFRDHRLITYRLQPVNDNSFSTTYRAGICWKP